MCGDLDRPDRYRGSERPDRMGPAEDHRDGHAECCRDDKPPARHQAERQAAECQARGEDAVHQPRVAAQPCIQRGHGTRLSASFAHYVIPRSGLPLILGDDAVTGMLAAPSQAEHPPNG